MERIIAHTNKITQIDGKGIEELNVKLVPRVYLDWNGVTGSENDPQQHWPADLHTFDYDSPAFQDRLRRLVEKLGQAWDDDPRIFAVQMGLIGQWGEHHSRAPTAEQRRLLAEAFQKAFKHKWRWLPGEDWDSDAFVYRRPAVPNHEQGHATLPANFKRGKYILALAILDRQGGLTPCARFATTHYFRGGWHPLGFMRKRVWFSMNVGSRRNACALRGRHYGLREETILSIAASNAFV